MTTYLADYQTFSSKTELNENVSAHLSKQKYKLNDTDQSVLLFLSRYSVKYYGASHLKVTTIADKLEKSRRTIQRSLKKLANLNMIEIKSFMRHVSGGYGANLYLILPFDVTSKLSTRQDAEKVDGSKEEVDKTENEPCSSFNQQELKDNTYAENTSGLSQSFYQLFKSKLISMLGDSSEAHTTLCSKLYGIYKVHSIAMLKYGIYANCADQLKALSLQAVSITLQASKKKPIRSLTGFFDGVYRNLILRHVIGVES